MAPFNHVQSSFATGVISPEVAARVDLDKYSASLLAADNVFIRPYGGLYKRPGTIFCGATKHHDKTSILRRFTKSDQVCYLLEIGEGYIRIWLDEVYTDIEVETDFLEADLPNLRFAQSADVLFIASGRLPVKVLKRYSDNDWRFENYDFSIEPFVQINGDEHHTIATHKGTVFDTAGEHTFVAEADGVYSFTISGGGGGGASVSTGSGSGIIIGGNKWSLGSGGGASVGSGAMGGNGETQNITISLLKDDVVNISIGAGGAGSLRSANASLGGTVNSATGSDGGTTTLSGAVSLSAAGGSGGFAQLTYYRQINENADTYYTRNPISTNGANAGNGEGASGGGAGANGGIGWVRIGVENFEGLTLISNKELFDADLIGSQIKLEHDIPTKTVEVTSANVTSASILVGEAWTFLTNGNWGGNWKIEKSDDGVTWNTFRVYRGNNGDFNANDNGTVDEPTYFRVISPTSVGGGAGAVFTSLLYTHKGIVEVVNVSSPTIALAEIVKSLGSNEATDLWYLSSWSGRHGYPVCLAFFQDRLSFAGTNNQPNGVWWSKTGDYSNFDTAITEGNITDDSSIAVNLIARELFDVRHMITSQDFILFTSGNEWLVSAATVLTPTDINPRMQTAWGCSIVEPLYIGNRIVYIQRRGGKVRDMGYSFESDNYTGDNLSIYVQHLTKDHGFTCATYAQEPDSMIFFVRDDGMLLCLTYVREQNVFAWSCAETKGQFEYVASVADKSADTVYGIVKRVINGEEVRYIERLAMNPNSDVPADHVMVDSAVVLENPGRMKKITGLNHLIGERVQVVADRSLFLQEGYLVGEDGTVELPEGFERAVIGLPYRMKVELPDVHAELKDRGSTQGQEKTVNRAILRLTHSFGGDVYTEDEQEKRPIFDLTRAGGNNLEPELTLKLVTNYEEVVLSQDTNKTGKVVIVHDEPYPFNLSAIVREVVL
jgi:Phage-related minor tail protein